MPNPFGPRFMVAGRNVLAWKQQNSVFADMAAFCDRTLTESGRPPAPAPYGIRLRQPVPSAWRADEPGRAGRAWTSHAELTWSGKSHRITRDLFALSRWTA